MPVMYNLRDCLFMGTDGPILTSVRLHTSSGLIHLQPRPGPYLLLSIMGAGLQPLGKKVPDLGRLELTSW